MTYVARYQRVASLIDSFKSIMEDIRISCKSSNRSALGYFCTRKTSWHSGKRIEDVYPIAEPIPLVIGAYRLIYLLINDMYIITVDLDNHSPFLALDVLSKVKEVVCRSMDSGVAFSKVEEKKVYFYYAFRRCINGMEGESVLGVRIRQILLASDPLDSYVSQNALYDINDVIHVGEVPAEAREFKRDAWEAVLHVAFKAYAQL